MFVFREAQYPTDIFLFFLKEPLPTHRSLGKSRRAPTRRPAVPAAPGTSHRRETALGFGRRGSCSGTVCGAWRRPHGPDPPRCREEPGRARGRTGGARPMAAGGPRGSGRARRRRAALSGRLRKRYGVIKLLSLSWIN